jgi:NAD(P)-dependent dehydrogenase (short-subunit alcohol dehydrogenase family)
MYGILNGPGLAGKSIVVTGGASGIGRSTALLLADAGALVTIGDINEGGMAETVRMSEALPGRIVGIRTDVAVECDIIALVTKAVDLYGRLDGAANVAGFPPHQKLLHELSLNEWQAGANINFGGIFLSLKHEIEAILRNEAGGSIVIISSNTAIFGFPFVSEYSAAKSATLGLVRAAVQEYGLRNIRINTLMPGPVDTPMLRRVAAASPDVETTIADAGLPGRYAHPDEIGYAARWLLSDEASFVNGAAIAIDGGMSTG